MIEFNTIHAAHKYRVKKLRFLGSSCIYPKFAPHPLKEGIEQVYGLLSKQNKHNFSDKNESFNNHSFS